MKPGKNLSILTPRVMQALDYIDKNQSSIIAQLCQIAKIPSPTFNEKEKIIFLKKLLRKRGIASAIDRAGNLFGKIESGEKKSPNILVVAHTDTVFKTEGIVKQTKNFLYGHGVCDNSTGVCALVTIVYLIKKFNLNFANNLVFALTVQEEGVGGKAGMKYIMEHLKNIKAVINLESHNLGRIVNQSPGIYRLKLKVTTVSGGHSFRNFGKKNAIVVASQIINAISQIKGFKKQDTTYNIGSIQGGETVNSIARKAEITLELRSTKQKALERIKRELEKIIKHFSTAEVSITKKKLYETTAAYLSEKHKIYNLTKQIHQYLRITSFFDIGNNDGEVSLARGIPTVTIGSSIGGKTHTMAEYIDKKSFILGLKQDFLVTLNVLHNF